MPTVRHSLPYLVSGQAEGHVTHNAALNDLDAFTNCIVLSRTKTDPSLLSPSNGDLYIVGASAIGVWSGKDNKLALYNSGWTYFTAPEGFIARVKDEFGCYYAYDGSWKGVGIRDIGFTIHRGSSGLGGRYLAAGMLGIQNCVALVTGAPAKDKIHAMPFIVPQGGTLYDIGLNFTALANLLYYNVGVYRATDHNNTYPDALVYDSGSISVPGGVGAAFSSPYAKQILPGFLHWLVYNNNSGATPPTIRCLNLANTMAILGLDSSLGTALGYGYEVAHTHTGSGYTLPTTFPGGATVKAATPVPGLFYRMT